ncbi:MAG: hypothetical protein AB7S78_13715 [Candidatus Omnitrophota bacterium]
MKKYFAWFLTAGLILLPVQAVAAQKDDARILVNGYLLAFRDKNESGMNEIYDRIWKDPAVLALVQENHPREYALINLRTILRRIDDLERRYGQGTAALPSPSGSRTIIFTSSDNTSGTLLGNRGNRSLTTGYPNQYRLSNQSRSHLSNSRIRRTNTDTVRAYSNQDRTRHQSNQQRLRGRR